MDADGWNVRSLAPDIFLRVRSLFSTVYHYAVSPPESLVWSPNGWLAFRDWSSHSLYTVHPEKPGVVTVGQTISDPAWSPDGEWIAWAHSEPGSSHDNISFGATIYVARIDGSEARPVFQIGSTAIHNPAALSLSWTPDGQSLRFVFAPSEFRYRLYQLSLGASNPQLIAEVPPWCNDFLVPRWQQGTGFQLRLYRQDYENYDDGEELLYTIAADGYDKRVLVRYGPVNGPVAANGE